MEWFLYYRDLRHERVNATTTTALKAVNLSRDLKNYEITAELNPKECYPHIETSQLICTANQLTRFYTRATFAFNELKPKKLYMVKDLHNPFSFLRMI